MSVQTAGAAAVAAVQSYGQKLKGRLDESKGLRGQVLFVDSSGKPFPVKPGGLANKIRMATDDTTLEQAKGVSQSFSEVFNSWYRFSHSSSGGYPSVPAETQSWTYDELSNSISNTTNSASYIGLVGPDNFTDYVFDATVSSSDPANDDDLIGLVLAFVVKDGVEYTLSLLSQGLKQTAGELHGRYFLAYNYRQVGGAPLGAKIFTYVYFDAPSFTWPEFPKGVRMRVERVGDVFNIGVSEPMLAGGSDALVHNTVFDLNSDPLTAVFKEGARVGYASQSQAYSKWTVAIRPEVKHDIVDMRNQDVWRFANNAWSVVGWVENSLARGRIYKDLVSNKSYVLHRDNNFYLLGGPGDI